MNFNQFRSRALFVLVLSQLAAHTSTVPPPTAIPTLQDEPVQNPQQTQEPTDPPGDVSHYITDITGSLIENCEMNIEDAEISLDFAGNIEMNEEDEVSCDSVHDKAKLNPKTRKSGISTCNVESPEGSVEGQITATAFNYTSVEHCYPSDTHLDVVSEIVTIEDESNSLNIERYSFQLGYVPDKELVCSHPSVRRSDTLICAWYDQKIQDWNTDGCVSTFKDSPGSSNETPVVKCECDHLTAFAILQDTASLQSRCELSLVLGNIVWIPLSCMYCIVLLICTRQLRDVLLVNGCVPNMRVFIHVMVLVICILNITTAWILYEADPNSSSTMLLIVLAIVWGTMYALSFAVYALVVLSWARIYHNNVQDTGAPKVLMNIFVITACFLSFVILVMFVVAGMTSRETAKLTVFSGSLFLGCICVVEAAGFLVYGRLLITKLKLLRRDLKDGVRLNHDRFEPLLYRLYAVTAIASASFILASIIPVFSGSAVSLFLQHFAVFQAIYSVLDVLTLSCVLFLFFEVIRTELKIHMSTTKEDVRLYKFGGDLSIARNTSVGQGPSIHQV